MTTKMKRLRWSLVIATTMILATAATAHASLNCHPQPQPQSQTQSRPIVLGSSGTQCSDYQDSYEHWSSIAALGADDPLPPELATVNNAREHALVAAARALMRAQGWDPDWDPDNGPQVQGMQCSWTTEAATQ